MLSLLALAAAQGAAQPQRALAGVWEGEVDSSAAARRLLAASTQLGQGAGISEADARAVGEATARLMSAGLGGVPQSAQVELGDALTRWAAGGEPAHPLVAQAEDFWRPPAVCMRLA